MSQPNFFEVNNLEELRGFPPRRNALMLLAADDKQMALAATWPRLRHLHVEAGFDKLTKRGLEGIEKLTGLESLCIKLCPSLDDKILRLCPPTLRTLEIITCYPLSDSTLDTVAALPELRHLDLTMCESVSAKGYAHLEKARKLRVLRLRSCDGLDAQGLKSIATSGSSATCGCGAVPICTGRTPRCWQNCRAWKS